MCDADTVLDADGALDADGVLDAIVNYVSINLRFVADVHS